MKDKTNWSSKMNAEEVSMGLDKISHELKGKVVCLHANMGHPERNGKSVFIYRKIAAVQ